MSSLRKGILTAALLMEWLLFAINPILLTTDKIGLFVIAAIVMLYAPELQGRRAFTEAIADKKESAASE